MQPCEKLCSKVQYVLLELACLNLSADGIPMDETRSSVPGGPYPENLPESGAECLRMMADGDAPASAQARLPGVDTHSTQALPAQGMQGTALSEVCLNMG